MQRRNQADRRSGFPARIAGGNHIERGGKIHRLSVLNQHGSKFKCILHALILQALRQRFRRFHRSIGYGFKRSIRQHRQHMARGIVHAQGFAVPQNHAVLVRPIIIGVDRQHRVFALRHRGERFEIRLRKSGVQTGSIPKPHIHGKACGLIAVNLPDRYRSLIIGIGTIIRPIEAGRIPRIFLRAGTKGKGDHHRKQKCRRPFQVLLHHFQLLRFGFAYRILRKNKIVPAESGKIFLCFSYIRVL